MQMVPAGRRLAELQPAGAAAHAAASAAAQEAQAAAEGAASANSTHGSQTAGAASQTGPGSGPAAEPTASDPASAALRAHAEQLQQQAEGAAARASAAEAAAAACEDLFRAWQWRLGVCLEAAVIAIERWEGAAAPVIVMAAAIVPASPAAAASSGAAASSSATRAVAVPLTPSPSPLDLLRRQLAARAGRPSVITADNPATHASSDGAGDTGGTTSAGGAVSARHYSLPTSAAGAVSASARSVGSGSGLLSAGAGRGLSLSLSTDKARLTAATRLAAAQLLTALLPQAVAPADVGAGAGAGAGSACSRWSGALGALEQVLVLQQPVLAVGLWPQQLLLLEDVRGSLLALAGRWAAAH